MLGDSFNKVPTKKMKKKKKSKQYETNICLLELKILRIFPDMILLQINIFRA